MPTDFSKLEPADCRLVPAKLVEIHNRLARFLGQVARTLPAATQLEAYSTYIRRYERLRELIIRPYYRVGFIGASQIGKSTTFNHVLGIVERLLGTTRFAEIAPATKGSKSKMTASVTRLHLGDHFGCSVKYLKSGRFTKRLEAMLKVTGLPLDLKHKPLDALRKVEHALKEDDFRPGPNGEEPILRQTLIELDNFLKAYVDEGAKYVRDDLPPQPIEWKHRGTVINHQPNEPISSRLLQQEVDLTFDRSVLKDLGSLEQFEELEMIDMPGVGASEWDDQLTGEFLEGLDAAFICIQATANINPVEFQKTVNRVRNHFDGEKAGRFGRRVWVLVTFTDGISEVDIKGNLNDGRTFADNLAASIEEKKLTLDRVYLVGNGWFEQNVQDNLTCNVPPQDVVKLWNVKLNDAGTPEPPASWDQYPDLKAAFYRLVKDGGISGLRQLMLQEMPQTVKASVLEDFTTDAANLEKELAAWVEGLKLAAALDPEGLIQVREWAASLRKIERDLERDGAIFRQPAAAAVGSLHQLLSRICPPDEYIPSSELHQIHADNLASLVNKALEELRDVTLKVSDEVGKRLIKGAPANDGKAKLQLGGQRLGPPEAWQAMSAEERLSPSAAFDSAVADLQQSKLFSAHSASETFNSTSDYHTHMRQRLELLVQRGVHLILRRLQERLTKIRKQLNDQAEAGQNQPGVAVDTKMYNDLLEIFCAAPRK